MKLNKYGMLCKEYLEEYGPTLYTELIIEGTIMDYLYDKQRELDRLTLLLESQLAKSHPKPITNNFLEVAKYTNMIQSIIEEFVLEQIKER